MALAPLLLVSCSEELGPEPMPTASISGIVHRSGEPLSTGWLEFLPVEGSVGRLRSVRIQPDGTFQGDSIATGTIAIRIVGANLPQPDFARFSQIYLVRREIGNTQTNRIEIDLDQELQSLSPGRPG